MATEKKGLLYWLQQIASEIESLSGSVVTAQSDWNEADETSPKYINNKPEIPDVKVITLEGLPSAETDTVALLNATGLTEAEVKAASEGKRLGLEKDGVFYALDGVVYTSATKYSLSFSNVHFELDSDDAPVMAAGSELFHVDRDGDTVTCASIEIV